MEQRRREEAREAQIEQSLQNRARELEEQLEARRREEEEAEIEEFRLQFLERRDAENWPNEECVNYNKQRARAAVKRTTKTISIASPCSICLEDENTNPRELPCGHMPPVQCCPQ